jgi:hypothetical protein
MKTPVYQYRFASSSGSKTYETLQYSDGTTSCDCMGWCRRVAADGSRTCKHVRFVEAGVGQVEALTHGPLGAGHVVSAPVAAATKPIIKQSTFARKFV